MIYIILLAVVVLLLVHASSTSVGLQKYANQLAPTKSNEVNPQTDIVIICTADGKFHGVDKFGRRIWTKATGSLMIGAENVLQTSSRRGRNYAVLPMTDGSIVHNSLEGMKKTAPHISVKALVEKDQFISQDGLLFSGSKKRRTFSLDAKTGDCFYDSEHKFSISEITAEAAPVWLSRVDYYVSAVDIATGLQQFNISYSEVNPVPFSPTFPVTSSKSGASDGAKFTQDYYNDDDSYEQEQEQELEQELEQEREYQEEGLSLVPVQDAMAKVPSGGDNQGNEEELSQYSEDSNIIQIDIDTDLVERGKRSLSINDSAR